MPGWKYLDLRGSSNPPEFHLALEEWILENTYPEPLILIFENPVCVVIGKNQNPWAEIDLDYAQEFKIPIYRRVSGGGTVFHGPGNLLFSFIEPIEKKVLVPMAKYNRFIQEALGQLGKDIKEDKRNCLFLNGKKISGNAQTIKGKRCLSHGTLLFRANLDFLTPIIEPRSNDIQSSAVESVRSKVGNIERENESLVDDFLKVLISILGAEEIGLEDLKMDGSEMSKKMDRHRDWDWVFGKTPNFEVDLNILIEGEHEGKILIEKGYLKGLEIQSKLQIPGSILPYKSKQFFDYLNHQLS